VRFSLFLAGAVAASAWSQGPRRESTTSADAAVVVGRVVADATGAPIRNARVTLSPASTETPVVLTDGTGAFRLPAPAGRYAVVATKTGYARGDAMAAGSGELVEVRLKKGAVIAGRVLDDRGEPVAGVQVAALRQTAAGSVPATVTTTDSDDRGEYRLAGLPDGAFIVGVTTFAAVGVRASARLPDPRTTYYPGAATVDEAQALRLQPGDERRGTDIIVAAEQLAGMPAGLFANRFLRGEPPALVRLGLEKPASPPTGAVRGRVLDVDGTPIRLAQIYLFASNNADSRAATTDGDGRFDVEKVVAGTLLVSVIKQGYVQLESGQPLKPFQMGRAVTSPSPGDTQFGRRLELDADQSRTVDLQMARWGTLSGTITDEYGDPMQGVSVEVLYVGYETGRRQLVLAGASRVTDDLGRYRLHDLAPGRYIVSAAVGHVSSDDLPGYGRAYFPGTANAAEAQYVSLGLAQDVDVVDFSMSKAPTARVTGIVLGPTGEPAVAGALTLSPSQRSSSVTSVPVGARIARDGTFVFPNVAPGEYVIKAYRGRSNAHTEGEFGAALVSVDSADVTRVTVRTSFGSSIAGRFRFERDYLTAVPKPSDVELAAIPVDFDLSPPANMASLASADIHANWTFEMAALNGPRRLELVRTPPGFALKEIRVNGVDVTDKPIALGTGVRSVTNVDVVLTDRVAELHGTVVDDRERPIAMATVIVFPVDRQQWYPMSRYLSHSWTSRSGAFTVAGLPSASYYASTAAAPEGDENAWQDPEFLESLVPGATTFSLGDGEKAVLTLHKH